MNSNYLTNLTFLLVLVITSAYLHGQVHHETILQNTTFQSSNFSGFGEMIINNPDHGSADLVDFGSRFYLEYTPDSSFLGRDTLVFEYSPNPSSIVHVTFFFDVRRSIITIRDDIFAVTENSDYAYFDVISNDTSSHLPIAIDDILLTNNGHAYVSNDSVFFKPNFGYTGIASFVYQACDSLGECAKGNAQFIVVDTSNVVSSDTLTIYTAENTSVNVLLPDTGFTESISPVKGYTENILNQQVFEYHPFQNQTGLDEFEFTNAAGNSRWIKVHIIDIPEPNSRVVDDYVYVTKNQSITFDVLENDLVSTNRIRSHSLPSNGSMTEVDDGVFEFIPDSSFQGLTQFTYTTCINGSNCETGRVKIFVGNLNPDNRSNYNLVTPKNRPIVINYEVPISNFMFDIEEDASHGVIQIYPGYDTLLIGCEEVRGNNLVVYEPDSNFVGLDEFDLKYCIEGSSNCEIVKVKLEVIDIALDSVCICADDCVWPGDIDADGKVSMIDLLSLGWHIGESGQTRPQANPNEWYGQYCPDWNDHQNNTENLKHTDVDGNGVVNLDDTIAISNFYGKVHNLMAQQVFEPLDYPIHLEIASPQNPVAGDYVVVDVLVGNQNFPAKELHGISLDFVFDPRIIDTSTMEMFFPNSSWLFNHQSQIDLAMRSGVSIRGAASRVDGSVRSGFGLIAKVGFIVEDDLDGIKLDDGKLRYPIQVNSAHALNGNGAVYALESDVALLSIDIEAKAQDEKATEVFLYPNPARDFAQIAINGSQIENIYIFDLYGKIVRDYAFQNNPVRMHRISTQGLVSGNYFVQIRTKDGNLISKKLQVY